MADPQEAGQVVSARVHAGGRLRAGRVKSFREIGDQAADLPQDMLAALGGVPCPLRRRIPVPNEKRIRTLLQDLDGT